MTPPVETGTVLAALTSAISEVRGLEPDEIPPGALLAGLEVDSLEAIEIVVMVGDQLDLGVDLSALVEDWSHLTVGELADHIACALRPAPDDHPSPQLPPPLPPPSQRLSGPSEDLRRDTSSTKASSS